MVHLNGSGCPVWHSWMELALPTDMDIFGHCPAHDEFYLVVCNHCSQVVKPQAFQKHCGEPGNSGNGNSSPWCWEQHRESHQGWLWGTAWGQGEARSSASFGVG
uniref:Ataxin 7 like 1 n=1 Tax=Ficedula albicollis TaxID=59894 RepID=A0A803VBL8_FICAL